MRAVIGHLPRDDQVWSEVERLVRSFERPFDHFEQECVQPALLDDGDLLIECQAFGVA